MSSKSISCIVVLILAVIVCVAAFIFLYHGPEEDNDRIDVCDYSLLDSADRIVSGYTFISDTDYPVEKSRSITRVTSVKGDSVTYSVDLYEEFPDLYSSSYHGIKLKTSLSDFTPATFIFDYIEDVPSGVTVTTSDSGYLINGTLRRDISSVPFDYIFEDLLINYNDGKATSVSGKMTMSSVKGGSSEWYTKLTNVYFMDGAELSGKSYGETYDVKTDTRSNLYQTVCNGLKQGMALVDDSILDRSTGKLRGFDVDVYKQKRGVESIYSDLEIFVYNGMVLKASGQRTGMSFMTDLQIYVGSEV